MGRGKERKKGSKYKVCNFYRFIPGIKLGIEGKEKRKKKEKGEGEGKRAQSLGRKKRGGKEEKQPARVKSKE